MLAKTSSLARLNIQEVLDQEMLLMDLHPQKESLVVQDSLEGLMLLVLLSIMMRTPVMLKLEAFSNDVYKKQQFKLKDNHNFFTFHLFF
jgi:hypothetical protein